MELFLILLFILGIFFLFFFLFSSTRKRMAMYEEYKLGEFVWYKPHLLNVEPMKMQIVGFRDPGPLELGEDEVLYVLRNEDGLVIYDATFQDISKLEEGKEEEDKI